MQRHIDVITLAVGDLDRSLAVSRGCAPAPNFARAATRRDAESQPA